MRAVIIQPHFLPFAGYFDLLARADVFVYYDTAQFRRRSWHCRTWISDQDGASWLSGAVDGRWGSRLPLCKVRWADQTGWRQRAERRLRSRYRATPHPDILEMILGEIAGGSEMLVDWNIRTCKIVAEALGIPTQTCRTSELAPTEGDKQDRLIQICRELGADRYLCGPGSRGYISESYFAVHGITVEWVDYRYSYSLTYGDASVYPSLLDLILVRGVSAARKELQLEAG